MLFGGITGNFFSFLNYVSYFLIQKMIGCPTSDVKTMDDIKISFLWIIEKIVSSSKGEKKNFSLTPNDK